MDEIKWLEVAINTTPERLDEITAKLTAAGMTGLVIEDETEFQQFLEQSRQYWDYVDQELMERMRGVTRVKFYVTDDADGRTQLERYTRGLECEYTPTPWWTTTGRTAGRSTISRCPSESASMWFPSGSGRSRSPRGGSPSI